MAQHKDRITELAAIMAEQGLSEAQITLGELRVGFKKRSSRPAAQSDEHHQTDDAPVHHELAPPAPEPQKGTPVTSPMTGIYYGAPSPGSPPFVKEGESITAGQVIGLIEAMKVFNEIPSPVSGTVLQIAATSGDLVQPGDVLLLIG